jgi:hypothetical protein
MIAIMNYIFCCINVLIVCYSHNTLEKVVILHHYSDHCIFEEMTYVFVSCNLGLLTSRQVALNKKKNNYKVFKIKWSVTIFFFTN